MNKDGGGSMNIIYGTMSNVDEIMCNAYITTGGIMSNAYKTMINVGGTMSNAYGTTKNVGVIMRNTYGTLNKDKPIF